MRFAPIVALLAIGACAELDPAELDPSEDDVAALEQSLNQLPTVVVTSPHAGDELPAGTPIYLGATAADPDGTVTKVEFFVDGSKVGEDTSAPYSAMWFNGAVGTHGITAKATDSGGGKKTSAKVEMQLVANQVPVSRIAFPHTNYAYQPGDTIEVEVEAKDLDGMVTSVELFANDEKIALKYGSPPWTFEWTDVPEGHYLLTARATDSAGAKAWSNIQAHVIIRSFEGGACDGLPDYVEGQGLPPLAHVRAHGYAWECIRAGSPDGCDGPKHIVEPGRGGVYGRYWTSVDGIRTCVPNICLGLPEYAPLTVYHVGDQVQHDADGPDSIDLADGGLYVCKNAAACSGPKEMFEPGVGSIWEEAWTWTDPCQFIDIH